MQYVLRTIWQYSKSTVPGKTRMLVQHRLLINGNVICPDKRGNDSGSVQPGWYLGRFLKGMKDKCMATSMDE